MQFVRAAAGAAGLAADGRDGIQQVFERHAVVDVGPGQQKGEREAAPVRDNVPLRARFAPVCRVRASGLAPLFAAIEALSRHARLQSIRPAARNRRSNARRSRSHTPRPLPVPQPPPAGHARPAPHFPRQHLPENAGLQHKQDAGQGRAVKFTSRNDDAHSSSVVSLDTPLKPIRSLPPRRWEASVRLPVTNTTAKARLGFRSFADIEQTCRQLFSVHRRTSPGFDKSTVSAACLVARLSTAPEAASTALVPF